MDDRVFKTSAVVSSTLKSAEHSSNVPFSN